MIISKQKKIIRTFKLYPDYFTSIAGLFKEPIKFVDQFFNDELDRYDFSSKVEDGTRESKSYVGIVNRKIALAQSFIQK